MKRYLTLLLFTCMVAGTLWAQEPTYIRHKVRWMETLYSIARKYKVDAKEIAQINQLTTNVKKGQILLIPVHGQEEVSTPDTLAIEAVTPEEIPQEDTYNRTDCSQYEPSSLASPIVSVLLPLSNNNNVASYVDFYRGVLLAAQDMKQQGMSAVLQCFDWNAYSSDNLLSDERLQQSQVVIGPVYSSDIGTALAYFRDTHTKIVSPLDASAEIWTSSYSNFFQVQPSKADQYQAIIDALKPATASIWVIAEEGEAQIAPELFGELESRLIPYRKFTYNVLDGREVTSQLRNLLGANAHNQIIVASQNEAFVSDALRNLHLLFAYNNIPIELFGLARWRSFETLDINALHQLQVMLPQSVFVDYSREYVKKFVEQYRALFANEPSTFAFQGYDVALYFLTALYRFGPDFEDCLASLDVPLLQSEYMFRQDRSNPFESEGGYCNTKALLIRYLPDFTLAVEPALK